MTSIGLRNITKERILVLEVKQALKDWAKATNDFGILIGGLAYSMFAKPRETSDIDVLYVTDNAIPVTVSGFKRTREHCYLHLKTHVEIDIKTVEELKIPMELFKRVVDTAEEPESSYGVKTASPQGIAALKLFRGYLKDLGDIEGLVQDGNEIDLTDWPIPEECWEKVEPILKQYGLHLRT